MNIVFFMSDSYRRDNLSCYGPTETRTPRLDAFAEQSLVFDNAYLGSFPTVPNRLDIMSGRFSCIEYAWQRLPADVLTFQEILSASGVTTQMIADTPHILAHGFNYSRGWDGWSWIRGQESDRWKTWPSDVDLPASPGKLRNPEGIKTHYRNTAWWESEEDRFVARTVQEACRWLERNQDQEQFFLYVDTFDPHEPWDAPQHYVDMYDPDYEGENPNYPVYGFWEEYLTPRELEHIRAEYRAEATMVDHWFGVLLDKLDALELADDTVVIFTTDHGYLFGEHGIVGKSLIPETQGGGMSFESTRMYQDICRTPLIIRMPGQTAGRHVDALVQSPDLMPTFLELAGLVATETKQGRSEIQALQCGVFYTNDWEFDPDRVHGESLVPLLRGETDHHRDFVVSSSTLISHSEKIAKCAIVTDDGWCLHYAGHYDQEPNKGLGDADKLINLDITRAPIEPALFYLPEDPGEMDNRLAENEALACNIHQRYVAWLESLGTPEEHLVGRRHFLIE